MPITAFNSFTDGLDPNRRNREHFIANTNLDDDSLWVPYADGVWFQPCCFNVTSGRFSVILKGLPNTSSAFTTTLARFVVIPWLVTGDTWSMIGLQSPGPSFTNLPARLTHWLSPMTLQDPALILFIVEGGLIYLDKAVERWLWLPTRKDLPLLSCVGSTIARQAWMPSAGPADSITGTAMAVT